MPEQVLGVVSENGRASGEVYDGARVGRLVALGGALSDPIRARMLGMMAGGRGCCSLPDRGVPAEDKDAGICVCEFEAYFGMGQSKVSYHMKKLKEAGLVREEKRGRWSFYSLNRDAARGLIAETADHLGLGTEAGDGR
ncbi:MAG TPA: metalloregulator ArsR/SmtB family transcription factor [Rubrobacter sp.]|nr:metalloregulator ArsR/SmtB family transcription factor [Rubrobacter sp.]